MLKVLNESFKATDYYCVENFYSSIKEWGNTKCFTSLNEAERYFEKQIQNDFTESYRILHRPMTGGEKIIKFYPVRDD
jgi:hypothetical protein